jgi:hypothetical protein
MGETQRNHESTDEVVSIERFQQTFEKLKKMLSRPNEVGMFKSVESFVYSFGYKDVQSLVRNLENEGYKVDIMKRSGSVRITRPGEYIKQRIENRDKEISNLVTFFEKQPHENFSVSQISSLIGINENRTRDLLKIMVGKKMVGTTKTQDSSTGQKMYFYLSKV